MNSNFFRFFGSIAICLFLFVGCATTGKLMKLHLQMTKSEVISAIGEPTAARGAMTNKYDQVIEVWEYALYKTDDDAVRGRPTFY